MFPPFTSVIARIHLQSCVPIRIPVSILKAVHFNEVHLFGGALIHSCIVLSHRVVPNCELRFCTYQWQVFLSCHFFIFYECKQMVVHFFCAYLSTVPTHFVYSCTQNMKYLVQKNVIWVTPHVNREWKALHSSLYSSGALARLLWIFFLYIRLLLEQAD